MRINTIVILLFLFSRLGLAQSDFRPGYYISNQFDTIHGLIDYRNDINNGNYCSFKYEKNDNPVTKTAAQIKGYRTLQGKYYVSKILPKDSLKNPVFLEYLIKGSISVYYRRTQNNERFYLEKNGELFEMNNDVKTLTDTAGIKHEIPTNQYQGILRYCLSDAPSLSASLPYLNYTKSSLIRLSKKYQFLVCHDEKCIEYEKDLHHVFNFGVLLGPSIENNKVTLIGENMESSQKFTTFQLGAYCQLNIPGMNEYLFIDIQGNYIQGQYKGLFTNEVWYFPYTMNFSEIRVQGALNYKFQGKTLIPNALFGYYYILKTTLNNSGTITPSYYNTPLFGPNQLVLNSVSGIVLGGGLDIPLVGRTALIFKLNYYWNIAGYSDLSLMSGLQF